MVNGQLLAVFGCVQIPQFCDPETRQADNTGIFDDKLHNWYQIKRLAAHIHYWDREYGITDTPASDT